MRRTILLACVTIITGLSLLGCETAPTPKPSVLNNFAGQSLAERERAYADKNVPALVMAVWKHDVAAIESLIAKGANVNEGKDDTPLLEAIDVAPEDLNIDVVKTLLGTKGIEVNKYSTRPMGSYSWCRTALIAAAGHGHTEVVKLLLDKGAKMELPDWYVPDQSIFGKEPLNTPLIYSVAHPETLTLLLDRGAKIEYQNSRGINALMTASAGGVEKAEKRAALAESISILLGRGAKVDVLSIPANPKYMKIDLPPGTPAAVNPQVLQNGEGLAAMHYAANTGFIDAAKLLLDKGAKIEITSYGNKWTPIMSATQTKQNDMISYLLDRGANIEATDTAGTNALQLTAMGLYYETAALLLKRGANINAATTFNVLEYACNVGRTDKEGESIKMMKLFLDNGVNIDYQAAEGSTALMTACGWGVVPPSPARAKLLLEKGAKIDIQNKKGETALMHAAYRGYPDIARALLDKGANVNLKTTEGRTALMIASSAIIDLKGTNRDFEQVVKLLLEKGADVNVLDKSKSNALSLATQYGRKETIPLLVAKGATLVGTAKPADPPIIGIWEGIKNSNPYAWYRFTFKSDNTWTYTAGATAALKKEFPDQFDAMNEQFKSQAAMEGNAGTFSFREQFLVLKTNSAFAPERVFQFKLDNGKLNLNGGEFVLSKVKK